MRPLDPCCGAGRPVTGATRCPAVAASRATQYDHLRPPASIRLRIVAPSPYFRARALQSGKSRKEGAARPREHRRRSSQLLHSIRAQPREFQWLETHLWHRKRMVMEPRWGFHLALRRADKPPAAAASVRARPPPPPSVAVRPVLTLLHTPGHARQLALQRCMLHDASYLACTEVAGSQEATLAALRRLMVRSRAPHAAGRRRSWHLLEPGPVLTRSSSGPLRARVVQP